LFVGRIKAAFNRALGAQGGNKVRVRLLLDATPDRRHWFRWERIFMGQDPVSTSPLTPFSRYLLAESFAGGVARNERHASVAVYGVARDRFPGG